MQRSTLTLVFHVVLQLLGYAHCENNLYVFVAHYHPFCLHPYGLGDFDEAERIAEFNNLTEIYDLRFAKVNKRDAAENPMSFSAVSCYGPPTFELVKYGISTDYGKRGKGSLSDYEKSTAGMLAYLEGQTTKSKVDVLRSAAQVGEYVAREEFSILGYFKDGSKNRFNYYLASEQGSFKGYKIAEVRNSQITAASYPRDTIVVNQEFGRVQLELDEDLTTHRILGFIKSNANSSSPIKDLTLLQLDNATNKTSLVFVMFYHDRCKIPEMFETVAEIAKQNGMLTYLDLRFATVDVGREAATINKYDIRESREVCTGMGFTAAALLRLFRYGKMIKYGQSSVGVVLSQDLLKLEGMLAWLDKNTKPAAVPILHPRDFVLKVEYNEVAVMGYFMAGSRARFEFYKAADELKDYVVGDVANADMNPYGEDIIVVFQNFGESRTNLTGKDNLTSGKIQAFVKTVTRTIQLPVPTRPPPTTTTDRPNNFYQETKQIAIFDLKDFEGNKILIDLSPGCIQIPESWGVGTWSIQTYGQCVDFYEHAGCSEAPEEKQFRLDDRFSPSGNDLSGVKPQGGFQSIQFCPKFSSDSVKTFSSYPQTFLAFTLLIFGNIVVA